MKKILITGKDSYIGTSFESWMSQHAETYQIETLDMKDESWRTHDFSPYDIVFHVAGIAHADVSKVSEETQALYYKVNRDLTVETAKKAKEQGVKQFIFMSSIIVYGESSASKRIITKDTIPTPSNFYGDSKLQAEEGLEDLASDDFNIAVIRPPMIYGKGSKGNYPKLARLAKKTPIFPDIDNQRSMLHIDNLCEFLRLIIENNDQGLFFPQNAEYVKTSELVRTIAEVYEKKIVFTKLFNPILKVMLGKVGLVDKVFGNLVYEKSMSDYDKGDYQIREFKASIEFTESQLGRWIET